MLEVGEAGDSALVIVKLGEYGKHGKTTSGLFSHHHIFLFRILEDILEFDSSLCHIRSPRQHIPLML